MAKKRKSKKQTFKVEYVAIIMLVYGVLSLFSWGFIGVLATNLLRVFVGEATLVVSATFIIVSVLMLLHKRLTELMPKRYIISIIIIYIDFLILLSLNAFGQSTAIFQQALQNIVGDLFSNQHLRDAGGGLVGSLLAQLFVFLFSVVGSYFIVVLISIIMLFVLSGKSLADYRQYFALSYRFITSKLAQIKQNKAQRQTATLDKQKQLEVIDDSPSDAVDNYSNEQPLFIDEPSEFIINGFTLNDDEQIQLIDDKIEQDKTDTTIKQDIPPRQVEQEDVGEDVVQFKKSVENVNYQLPPIHLLNKAEVIDQSNEYDIIKRNSRILEETFKNFGVNVRIVAANLGPSVTKYEIQPAIGVKVSKIVNLTDDIALALAAKDIRIEAPIPGKSLIGIEVPNQQTSMVSFREIIEGNIHSASKLEVPLGRDISGNIQIADLSKMPHLLVAGATGSGKSVAINGMITSILMKAKPNEVKLMMVDPKKVELNVYNGIPHLLTPVVTNPRRAAQALQKVVMEMERRYELFAQTGSRNIIGYNDYVMQQDDEQALEKLPYIVVIVDELADLMMVASNEVEAAIIRLAQMARAAGIHMVLATQRPSVDVITGLIKANVPSRMAFAVSSSIDSRTIIDSNGAEKLLGKGDMLFMPMGENKPIRVQGAFLSDQEVERVVEFVKTQQGESYVEEMMPTGDLSLSNDMGMPDADDELIGDIIEFLADQDYISVSMLQRRFRIGFNRASRLMDDLETRGYVGQPEGTKPRKVLMNQDQ